MAYDTIEPHVRGIIKGTRNTDGLPRAASDIERELGERALKLAENEEKGSGQKGSLEQAITHFRTSFERFPTLEVAQLLSSTYKALGDVKKEHSMPGYEGDYTRSADYQEKAKELTKNQRGPERIYPHRR